MQAQELPAAANVDSSIVKGLLAPMAHIIDEAPEYELTSKTAVLVD
jgi:hypothetical protein